ncbi:hypothetical protein IH799_09950 [candidate division KSB1 bacterium]|nr:hypothetical protein [candidate division KSB1 bacterium]
MKSSISCSIFAEKLVFEDKKYRTSQINEVLALLTSNINHLGIPQNKKAIKNDGLLRRASPIVKISNQLIEDFKKIYELRPILPVAALKIKELRKENYSYLIG